MPHVKFGVPYTTSDGKTHVQGETAYVSSGDAKKIVADGRGKVVKLSPEEVLEVAGVQAPKPTKAEEKPAVKRPPVKKDDADG
ncbi:hypothetical protein [Nocardiopsis composta]|uniref:Uncharacterized protein n=1 Tax=Nocardiopsis composta TaxID=157465 RepID=A0A7W8QIZ1_9ACTN|nr:hypothetical protein [Nocardiopsis composta]MBB5431347.1 hypothetical protein [Nocardiopsis composta]